MLKKISFKLLKYFAYLCILFLFVIGLIIGYLYIKYPPEKWKDTVVYQIEKLLFARIEIKSISYSFDGSIVFNDVIIYDIDPSKNSNKDSLLLESSLKLLEAKAIELYINPAVLWEKKLRISSVKLKDTTINVLQDRTSKKYKINWQRVPYVRQYLFNEKESLKDMKEPDVLKEKSELKLEEFSLENITIDNLTLNWQAANYYPITGLYTFDIETDIEENNLKLLIDLKLPKEEKVKADVFWQIEKEKNILDLFEKLALEIEKLNFPYGKINLDFDNFTFSYLKPFEIKIPLLYIDGNVNVEIPSNKPDSENYLKIQTNNLETLYQKDSTFKMPVKISGTYNYNMKTDFLTTSEYNLVLDGKNSFSGKELNIVKGDFQKILGDFVVDLKSIQEKFNLPFDVNGIMKGEISYQKENKHPYINATFENVNLTYQNLALLLKSNFSLEFKNNEAVIKESLVNILNHDVNFSAKLRDVEKEKINLEFNIEGDEFNINKLLSQEKTVFVWPRFNLYAEDKKEISPNIDIKGFIKFEKLKYNNIQAKNLKSKVFYENKKISLDPIQFNLASGDFLGNYELRLDDLKKHNFKLNLEKFKMHEFYKMFEASGNFYSTISGVFEGQMSGMSPEEFQKSINATVFLKGSRGKMEELFFQKAFLGSVLAPLEDKLRMIEFDSFQMELAAKDSMVYVRNSEFESYQLKIKGMGKTDWNWQGEVSIILRFTDNFIQDIANLGRLAIQDSRMGSWYNLPFSCQGNITEVSCYRQNW
ncbi:MAG: AsmA family protein [Spirochaetia bacterium]|nr:AsmA family protein [Spirochaetia bacterium]